MATQTAPLGVFTPEDVLKHWQGHRRLTRRTLEAFPEDQLFGFSVGGMRPFSDFVWELLRMAVPIVDGVSSGKWVGYEGEKPTTKAGLLTLWDQQTKELDSKFPEIPPHRFQEIDKAFGQWECSGITSIQYGIDNEIHHRGQGYVYLRALGIAPPNFWEGRKVFGSEEAQS